MTTPVTTLRLLLVEDSPDDAELIARQLERGGYALSWKRVAGATELEEALATESWDVVVSDYRMHGFDAPAALEIVQRMNPELPFIIVSGSVGEELAVRAMKSGAHDFFLKDRLDRLPSAIAREVGEGRVRAERKDALQRLHTSEERLRALVEQVIVGMVQTDLDGRFTFANERFCEIAGRPRDALLLLREQDIAHPDDIVAYASLLERARSGERAFVVAKRYLRPDGTEVWVNANVTLVSSGDGVTSVVSVVEDITGRRRADRERERLVADLERTLKLSEMFIGVLGHDLRNPLQTITMASSMLLQPTPRDVAANAGRILRAGDRMRRMIDQLLDFTRMRMGMGIPLVSEPADLAEIARHAIDEIVVGHEGSEVDFRAEGSAAGCWDRDRLLQLVSNLVANAVDHREAGSPVRVLVEGHDNAWVRFEVQNRGVIPPAILPLIFQPLQTTKRTKQDRASGLGLGLFITRQIARAHGGSIRVESDEAMGTRFIVELPREPIDDSTSQHSSSFDVLAPGSGAQPD